MWSPSKSANSTSPDAQRRPIRTISALNRVSHLLRRLHEILAGKVDELSFADSAESLYRWRTELPDHLQSPNQSMNPPILHLHLLWNFVMATLISQPYAKSYVQERVLQETAGSMHTLANDYIRLTGLSSSSPLLTIFALQAQESLTLSSDVHLQIGSTLSNGQLRDFVETLCSHWQGNRQTTGNRSCNTYGSSLVVAAPKSGGSSSVHRLASPVKPFPPPTRLFRPDWLGPSPSVRQHARNLTLLPTSQRVSIPEWSDYLGTTTLSATQDDGDLIVNDNGYDAMLEEIIASAPPRRPEQDAAFAQNLGFLTDDFNNDFFAFLRNARPNG